jgi:hypothetical protein
MTTNAMTFGQDMLMSAKLSATRRLNIGMARHPWATIGASTTLHHHSSNPFRGYLEAADMDSYNHKCRDF